MRRGFVNIFTHISVFRQKTNNRSLFETDICAKKRIKDTPSVSQVNPFASCALKRRFCVP